jgi:hypothetical protein
MSMGTVMPLPLPLGVLTPMKAYSQEWADFSPKCPLGSARVWQVVESEFESNMGRSRFLTVLVS